MNRETKRAMARQQTTDPAKVQQMRRAQLTQKQQAKQQQGKEKPRLLTRIRTFLSEVTAQLKKVTWPKRNEVVGYTVVVVITLVVITAFIYGLDTVFGWAVLKFFG